MGQHVSGARSVRMSRHILILVENPRCRSTAGVAGVPGPDRGWSSKVTVICPTGVNQTVSGRRSSRATGSCAIRCARPAAGRSAISARVHDGVVPHAAPGDQVRRSERIDIVQACNPPDLLFLIALGVAPGRHSVRLRPPRHVPRDVPVAVSAGPNPPLADQVRRTTHLRRRRRGDLDERELSARRDRAAARWPPTGGRGAQRARPEPLRPARAGRRVAPRQDVSTGVPGRDGSV